MSLWWLVPSALALCSLILGPILAHLIKRNPSQKVPFGAMMLLRKLPKELRRKRRLQDYFLLLLRILAVLLIVLAAAQPELRWPSADSDVQRARAIVLVIDNSLSMDQLIGTSLTGDRKTAFLAAKKQAIELVKSLPEGVKLGVVKLSEPATGLTSVLVASRSEALSIVDEMGQEQGATDLLGGLRLARQMLEGKGGEIFVFSDESGPNSVPAAREEIALLARQNAALVPRVIRPAKPANISVVQASYGEGLEGGVVRFSMMNFGDQTVEVPATAQLPDGTKITTFVELEGGKKTETFVTVPRVAEGGVGKISLQDPALLLDNHFYFHLPRIGASRVLLIDGDSGATAIESEVYFVERALAPFGGNSDLVPDVIGPAGIQSLDPEAHRVVFMANVADPAPLATTLVGFVRNGGGLVLSVGNNVTAERYNAAFSDLLPAPLRKVESLAASREQAKATALPKLSRKLFRPFSRGGVASFQKIRWIRLFSVQPFRESKDLQTLLRLENGMPLLIEKKLGKGRILFLAGSIDRAWGNFPMQSAFMPLMQRVVSYLGGASSVGGVRYQGTVGKKVTITMPEGVSELMLDSPSGAVGFQRRAGELSFTPKEAGAYRLYTPGAPSLAWIAVNTDAVESDVRPGPSLLQTAAEVDPERFMKRASLSPWLALIALFLAALQGWLAIAPKEEDNADT